MSLVLCWSIQNKSHERRHEWIIGTLTPWVNQKTTPQCPAQKCRAHKINPVKSDTTTVEDFPAGYNGPINLLNVSMMCLFVWWGKQRVSSDIASFLLTDGIIKTHKEVSLRILTAPLSLIFGRAFHLRTHRCVVVMDMDSSHQQELGLMISVISLPVSFFHHNTVISFFYWKKNLRLFLFYWYSLVIIFHDFIMPVITTY